MRRCSSLALILIVSATAGAASESIERLEMKLARVEKSIRAMKGNLKSAKEVEFLAELYLSLAELLIEKSRVQLSLKHERNPGTPEEEMDFTLERQSKLEAIEIYKQVISRFPKHRRLDRVLFFVAHEHRELNQIDEALKYYKRIVNEFPESQFWDEAQLNIADHYFLKKDFDFARMQYSQVTVRTHSKGVSAAWYKIGWCYINKAKWYDSMIAFEKSLEGFSKSEDAIKPSSLKNSDMREEALMASVWPYSELVGDELKRDSRWKNPVDYYRGLAPDRFTYSRVMARLGRRLSMKKRFQDAAAVFYQALSSTGDDLARLDLLEDYYRAFKNAQNTYYPEDLSGLVAESLEHAKRIERDQPPAKQRASKFEPLLRDIATSTHQTALATKRVSTFAAAARAYDDYLFIFPKSKWANEMRGNLAESYYRSDQKIEAAKIYLKLAQQKRSDTKTKLRAGLQSLAEILVDTGKLIPLEKLVGQSLYLTMTAHYLRKYPNDPVNEELRFNVSKIEYDERNFKSAISNLTDYLRRHPNSQHTEQAGLLLLDCYYQQDQLKDLVDVGKRLAADQRYSPRSRNRFQSVTQEAQLKRVRSLAGDFSSKGYADKMLSIVQSKENAGMAEPALNEAFLSLRTSGDPKVFSVGETYLAKFQESERAKSVITTMIQMALTVTDFNRAATYLETYYHRYSSDPQAATFAQQAISIYKNLGRYREAAQLAKRIGNSDLAMSLLAEGRLWSALAEDAPKISSAMSEYYNGLALIRSGQSKAGFQMMEHLVQEGKGVEKFAMAHAYYLVMESEFKRFLQVGVNQTLTPKLIAEKVAVLDGMERLLQSVLAGGDGRWILASLGLVGKAKVEMARFLANANGPTNLDPVKFRAMMSSQVQNYTTSAKTVFEKCLQAANESEVLSRFTASCLTGGRVKVGEADDIWLGYPKSRAPPAKEMIKKLLVTPRSVPALQSNYNVAKSMREWGAAELILDRLYEVSPSPSLLVEHGWLALETGQYQKALEYFRQAEKAGMRDGAWGKAALYAGLNLTSRLKQMKSILSGGRVPASAGKSTRHRWLELARSKL